MPIGRKNPVITKLALWVIDKDGVLKEVNRDYIDNSDQIYVDIWITNEDSKYWCANDLPKVLEPKEFQSIGMISTDVIKDIKEGDTFKISVNGHIVELTAMQKKYRYYEDKFEDTLNNCLELYRGYIES